MILAVGIGTVLNEIEPRDALCPTEVGIFAMIQKTMNVLPPLLRQTMLSQLRRDGTIDDSFFDLSRK